MRKYHFVFILLTIIFLLNILSVIHKTLTYDEPRHYEYGMNILKFNSSKFTDSVMPFSCVNAILGRIGELLKPGKFRDFLCKIETARFITILFSLLVAFYVFKWTEELYGTYAGFFSLILYTFSPNIIAHSQLVTTDLYATGMMVISMYYFWQFIKFGGWKKAALSASVLGLAQLAKHATISLYPIFILTLLIRYSGDLLKLIRAKNFKIIAGHLKSFVKFTLFFVIVSIIIINIGFLFNKSFTPLGEYVFKSDLFKSIQSKCIALRYIPIPLPYPYLEGIDGSTFYEETGGISGNLYLLGKLHEKGHGFMGYYFYAFLYKVPIPIQLFILFSILAYIVKHKKYDFLKDEIFLLCPILCVIIYLNFFFKTQVGIRYSIIVFPLLHIFCGSLLKNLEAFSQKLKLMITSLLIYLIISVLSYFPHYLSYFNELVWDRKQAYKILADSNIDWGQNEWYLEKYVEKYPDSYINPEFPVVGRVIVTVNYLTGIFFPERYKWLRDNFKPVEHIAYSYLVYDISLEDLLNLIQKYGHSNAEAKQVVRVLNGLGNLYLTKGDIDKAVEYYKEAVKRYPSNIESLHNLMLAYYRQHNCSLAVSTLNQLLKLTPEMTILTSEIADCYPATVYKTEPIKLPEFPGYKLNEDVKLILVRTEQKYGYKYFYFQLDSKTPIGIEHDKINVLTEKMEHLVCEKAFNPQLQMFRIGLIANDYKWLEFQFPFHNKTFVALRIYNIGGGLE